MKDVFSITLESVWIQIKKLSIEHFLIFRFGCSAFCLFATNNLSLFMTLYYLCLDYLSYLTKEVKSKCFIGFILANWNFGLPKQLDNRIHFLCVTCNNLYIYIWLYIYIFDFLSNQIQGFDCLNKNVVFSTLFTI